MSMYSSASIRVAVLLAVFAIAGCATSYQPSQVQYDSVRITDKAPRDPKLEAILSPYADSVNSSMNKVIAELAISMEKKLPEGTLNNLVADALLAEARAAYGKVDAAFVNYGGVRVSQIPAGPITIGKVFELMPFDNLVIIQELKGSVFQEFLNKVAERGGWPSAGVQFVIKDKKAQEILVGGQALDLQATYRVANSDYVANGGDDCDMLRKLPQINNGLLMRDAFLHYFEAQTKQGKKLNAELENRIRYAQ